MWVSCWPPNYVHKYIGLSITFMSKGVYHLWLSCPTAHHHQLYFLSKDISSMTFLSKGTSMTSISFFSNGTPSSMIFNNDTINNDLQHWHQRSSTLTSRPQSQQPYMDITVDDSIHTASSVTFMSKHYIINDLRVRRHKQHHWQPCSVHNQHRITDASSFHSGADVTKVILIYSIAVHCHSLEMAQFHDRRCQHSTWEWPNNWANHHP